MGSLIRINPRQKRLLELEKVFNPEYRSISDVLEARIDFNSIEKKFKKLLLI